jgi:hypothetical protein
LAVSDKRERQVWIYPERLPAVLRQLAADLVVLAWVLLWIRIAVWAHDLIEMLAAPGRQVERLAGTLSVNLDAAARAIDGIPLIGDGVTGPLGRAAGTAQTIADAGRQQQEWVHSSAYLVPAVLLIIPLGIVLLWWLPRRIRRIRATGVTARMRRSAAGLDALALRALAGRPLAAIEAAGPDIAEAWRRGDPGALAALSFLELRRAGLKAPRMPRDAPVAACDDLPTPADPWSVG